jgi:hypothetical protein
MGFRFIHIQEDSSELFPVNLKRKQLIPDTHCNNCKLTNVMYGTFIFFVEQIFILPTSSVTLDCCVQQ